MDNQPDNATPDRSALEALLATVALGEATDEQLDQLNDILLRDEKARELTCDFMAGEAVLQRHFQLVDRVATLHGSAHELQDAADLEDGPTDHRSSLRTGPWNLSPKTRGLFWSVGVAACLLLALFVWNGDDDAPQPSDKEVAANESAASQQVGTLVVGVPPQEVLASLEKHRKPVRVGDTISTDDKITFLHFDCGVDVLLMGPAELSVVSPMRAELSKGTLTARVAESAHGFRIDTPNSKVTDLGTEFGVSVDDSGVTDTVVFSGKVAMEYRQLPTAEESRSTIPLHKPSRSQLLTEGNALRVTQEGLAERIVSVTRSDYPLPGTTPAILPDAGPVIRDVWDNLSTRDTSKAYQIVHNGFREDAGAFVDRKYQWNGISAKYGLPRVLRGGDYVMPFCDDKVQDRIQVTVDLARPARLFVLLDNRLSIPGWLRSEFTDTGYDVGIDEDAFSVERSWQQLGEGPGVSLERSCSVWYVDVPNPHPVVLGALDPPIHWRVMYGIVAVPLEEALSTRDEPVANHQPKIGSGLIHRGLLPEPATICEIERGMQYGELMMGLPTANDFGAVKNGLLFRAETLDGLLLPHPDTTVLEGNVAPALNDGLLADSYDDLKHNFWYNGQGRFSIDLKQSTKLQSIRTYSVHWLDRSFQNFTVWGSQSEKMPPVDFETAAGAKGWELIGIVNTDVLDPGGLHASVLSAGEEGIGPYRHLLWVLEYADRSTFLTEIDIFELGTAPARPMP
ncbi:FecR domain-containing protein [Aeoliella sp. ICT_H6.2]|uniref:FecR domain-containing protein n=1 Tax=Aeoliella straminimaris TaxID=2954799 RepID=A0A9X2FDT4_9BACT|nr:FecR domain-containing protein [Aeoliella straminimaris]